MRKRIVYIGLILILVAVASFFVSGALVGGNISKNIITENITVGPNSYGSLQVNLAAKSVLLVQAGLSKPANLYIFNSSAYSKWASYLKSAKNSSGISYAKSLNSDNISLIEGNASVAEMLYPKNFNVSKAAVNQTVYAVVDNTDGSPSSNSSIHAQLLYVQLSAAAIGPYQIVNVANVLLFIAGVIIAIYGAIRKRVEMPIDGSKPGSAGSSADKEYVDQLYKGVKKSTRKKKSGSN